ncbi:MAG TPA: hypothetical protein VGR95_04975 [Thermoanaerobaculia bacterium]|nr:hypothetical protein [Thermoanaerobaculia bacterium]
MRIPIRLAMLLIVLGHFRASMAQLPPIYQVGTDPVFGPICAGPGGTAPCAYVQAFESIAQRIPVQFKSASPFGPICAGPIGDGPCADVQRYLLNQALSQIQLPQLFLDPHAGPVCGGPLGPGPCDAVRFYIVQVEFGLIRPEPNGSQVTGIDPELGAICTTAMGPVPCSLAQQQLLDSFPGNQPPQTSFNVPNDLNAADLALACAHRAGIDPVSFAACTGHQIILNPNQQAILDCAVSHTETTDFAKCAAPHAGVRLPDETRLVAGCAMKSNGNAEQFATCTGAAYASRPLSDDEQATLKCVKDANGDSSKFAACAGRYVLGTNTTDAQRRALKCVADSRADAEGAGHLAICLGDGSLSDDQKMVAKCALHSNGERDAFLSCAASNFVAKDLSDDQKAALACAAESQGDVEAFAACAGPRLFGIHLTKEESVALKCAAQSQGSAAGFAVCAGANMFNLQLNPEQQVAVQCVASTGGQPYAAAGCIASRLTARELTKCLTDGFGGKGCFGDSNDLVGKDGWVGRNLSQIAGGPNSVFNNPAQLAGGPNSFVRNPNQIWGGDNSFLRNPGQMFGGSNSFVRNPSQFWGGANSIFNNPGQLLPSPPRPLQLGTVGGKRICIPWC